MRSALALFAVGVAAHAHGDGVVNYVYETYDSQALAFAAELTTAMLSPAEKAKHEAFVKSCEKRFDIRPKWVPQRALATLCEDKEFISG